METFTAAAMGQPERLVEGGKKKKKKKKKSNTLDRQGNSSLSGAAEFLMACVPPVGATVAVDMASPCAPGRRALEDVFVHGQDCEDEKEGV